MEASDQAVLVRCAGSWTGQLSIRLSCTVSELKELIANRSGMYG